MCWIQIAPCIWEIFALISVLDIHVYKNKNLHFFYYSAASRVLKIMCGVINFIKFQQGRIQIYQDLKDENVS